MLNFFLVGQYNYRSSEGLAAERMEAFSY